MKYFFTSIKYVFFLVDFNLFSPTNDAMTSIDLLTENEKTVVEELKKLCYSNGREINVSETSELFHKLGIIYSKKGPEKVTLIQSVALLNAALVRDPHNIQIERDIDAVCHQVLTDANAFDVNADLRQIARSVKRRFVAMRENINNTLKKRKKSQMKINCNCQHPRREKVAFIKKLQENITREYIAIMHDLAQTCLEVMGEVPAKINFALAGMGSIARKETTPYSDFESFILLENGLETNSLQLSRVLKYFRWYAVIFQIVLINLGETILPSVAIPSLNDFEKANGKWFYDAYTTRGVSFDGMMPHACKNPLGRQTFTCDKKFKTELIQPVKRMLRYLDTEEDLKNGYHLADILTTTCFIFGNKDIYEEFLQGVDEILERQKDKKQAVLGFCKQVKEDLCSFDMVKSLNSFWWQKSKFNLKHVMYRSTTLFLAIIAKCCNVEGGSSFELIEQLAKMSLITTAEKLKLEYAIAVACEVRLKVYMGKKTQDDWMEQQTEAQGKAVGRFIELIGEQSIVDYCETACQLQDNCRKIVFSNCASTSTLNFAPDVVLRAEICCALRLHDMCIQLCKKELQNQEFAAETELTKLRLLNLAGVSYLKLNKIEKALGYFQQRLQILKNNSGTNGNDIEIANCLISIGSCFQNMKNYGAALEQFEEGLRFQRRASEGNTLENQAFFRKHRKNNLSQHISKGNDFELGLNLHNQSSFDGLSDTQIATNIGNIGICMARINEFTKAIEQFEQEAEIRKRIVNEEPNLGLANCYRNIALCKKKTKDYVGAIQNLKMELKIRSEFCQSEDNKISLAQCHEVLVVCFIQAHSYQKALSHGQTLLSLRQSLSSDETADIFVADCFHLLGLCYVNIKQETQAIEAFQKELEIRSRLSANPLKDQRLLHCKRLLGICLVSADRVYDGMCMLQEKRKSVF